MENFIKKYKVAITIGIVWLFHISAIIGINLGNLDWFIEKTPLNLCLSLLLFFISYPLIKQKQWIAFVIFFAGGMFAEWLGVKFNLLFGTYAYGNNFGPKIDGVPLLIGCYWALLTFITSSILNYSKLAVWPKIILGATLMVILDFFMEHSAPTFDFWTFEGNLVPLQNYVAWFSIAILFHIILRLFKINGNKVFSLNLYLAQLIFFMYFYFL
ncbi:carotenoid biosynthesis protein [Maribacter sp. 2308TA10-17]|uniref:carotenoid biosynthesis protein n=1 Tax=Maribacter sp. 2308TA10-17 TaxID=3386276 RepID=UPI0039BC93D1